MTQTYAYIIDNAIVENEIRQGRPYRNFSFGKNSMEADYRAANLWPIVGSAPSFDPDTEVLEGPTYQVNTDEQIVQKNYNVRALTQQEVADRLQTKRNGMVVSPFQAKAAMLAAGIYSTVESLVLNSEDETLKLAWEYAIEWRRTSPSVIALAQAANLTDVDLDNLFEAAALIEA